MKIKASEPITSWQIEGGNVEAVTDFIFLGSKITADGNYSHEIKRCLLLGRKTMRNLDRIFKSRDITLPYSQSDSFSSSQVWMWELNHKEGWSLKNWCSQIVVLEKTLESLLDCKEVKPVNTKKNQPWIFNGRRLFIRRTDAEIDTPILWSPDVKSWPIAKDPEAGKNWRQRRRWQQRKKWLESITDSMDMNLSKLRRQWRTEKPGML